MKLITSLLPAALLLALAPAMAADAGAAKADAAAAQAAVSVDTDSEALRHFDALDVASSNHPNEQFRLFGQKAAATGHWGDAAKLFRIAARYADKYSQHRLSLLYWYGQGVEKDRVEAYLWADIAAERGYPQFLAIREKMWAGLTPAEQAEVPKRGPALYAEFGDPAAKPRFEVALLRGKQQMTGSRTGFNGGVGVSSGDQLRGTLASVADTMIMAKVVDPAYNDPKKYWEREDRAWKHAMVRIGEIEEVKDVPADAQDPQNTQGVQGVQDRQDQPATP